MNEKTVVLTSLIIVVLMLSMTVAPSLAFIYPDGSQDNYFENYGPRIDAILVKKYASLQSEIDALKAGEIDFTDWPLEKSMVDNLSTDPNIAVVGYGGENIYYTLNFNNNPNQYLGNPEDPAYANPVYPNPMAVAEFRQACTHLVDRVTLASGPGMGMYEPIYTPIPAYMSYWIHPEISYTGLLSAYAYPPSVVDAAAKLDAGGFHLGGAGGKRYWDKNDNNVYDGASEDFNILAYTRADILRKGAADMLCNGFDDPLVKVSYTRIPCTAGQAWQTCMVWKNYHLYTAGWIYVGPDPDYLFDLYHWDNYYHPQDPPNYGAISQYDTVMQDALEGIKYSSDALSARSAAYAFQERFAEVAAECPLGSTSAPKAYNKWYTGGNDGAALGDAEDKYRHQSWTQVVNEKGKGENSAYTFLNAYPGNFQHGDGNMIARYGWKEIDMPQTLNPMYSSWYWEAEVYGRIYDTLGGRDPMTQGPVEVPGIAENWTLGTWIDYSEWYPETLSKVTVTIRPDVLWSDGKPLVIDDLIYTFIEMPAELRAKGCPDVWWQPTLDRIVGFFRLDRYTVEILLDVHDSLAVNWIISNIIVPKHIWHPYIATHTAAQIAGDMADSPEMLVGSGPFTYVSNDAQTLSLVRNPTYCHIMDDFVNWYSPPGPSWGITIEAIAPASQLSPSKINSTTPTSVRIMVPVTHHDVDEDQYINVTVEVVCPNGTVVLLSDTRNLLLSPFWTLLIPRILYNLDRGIYTMRVTVTVSGGAIYDWVTANLESSLWPMILGPRTIEKKFWVTVLGDLNEDCVVDIFDIAIVCSHFGAYYGEPLYISQADVNRDLRIDIFDIVQVAIVFGFG